MTRHAANLVTLLRVALVVPFALAVRSAEHGGSGWPAAVLFALAAASDHVDGRVARQLGVASTAGRALDHGADIVFLLAALTTYVALGVAPWWVPASIAAAFAVYVGDSLRRSGGAPRLIGSRIGHLGGICNYVLVGVLVGNHTVGLGWLPPPLVGACFAAVPLYSGLSIALRLRAAS